ncbi:MAG: DNA polymerase Y family protein [Verrucomicrobiota bacterium]
MFAAFHIANLPIVASLLEQPEWHERPCAILREPTDKDDGKIPLLSLNEAASQTGIAPGWQLNRALVRCPDLTIIPRQPETEAALLRELAVFADRFTADFEILPPDMVLLDLTGTKRAHFEGLESLPDSEVEVCHALAETPDLALFAVLEPRTRGRFVSIREIGSLPLSRIGRLEEDAGFLPLLALLGINTLEDFRRLPRQGLTERFGARAGHWHDVIQGKTCRLLKLHRPPESFFQTVDFDDAVHSSEALIFVFNRLLHVLAARLAARHLAASVLKIHLRMTEGSMKREIHIPEPMADPAALLKPIQTLIDSMVLSAPVTAVELDAVAAFPLSSQSDWTKRRLPNPERWADTLARLEALAGDGRVGIPVPLEVHRPDSFEMRDATVTGSCPAFSNIISACGIPLRRFRPPVNISVAFESIPNLLPRPLALLTGPHCGQILEIRGPFPISGGYWDPSEKWSRLEWDIRLEHAPLLRLVYQPKDRWQLEGTYG